MTIKNKIILSLLISIIPFSYSHSAEYNSSDRKIIIHVDGGLAQSLNAKGTYQDKIGNSLIIGVGAKVEVYPKIKMGISVAHRSGFRYDRTFYEYVKNNMFESEYTQTFKITSIMYNISYDLYNIKNIFTPFVECGLGVAIINPSGISSIEGKNFRVPLKGTFNSRGTKYNPSWNIGGGISMFLIKNISLSAVYKYNNFGRNTSYDDPNQKFKGILRAHEFIASIGFII